MIPGRPRPRVKPLRLVHAEASRECGESELRTLNEALSLAARGHDTEIWAPAGSGIAAEAERRGLRLRALPLDKTGLAGVLAVRRALRETQPDVVSTHRAADAWLVTLARLGLRAAPPVVHTLHAEAAASLDWPARWLLRHAMRHVITTDEALRERLLAREGFRASRVSSIPDTADGSRMEHVFVDVLEGHANRRRGVKARWDRLKHSLERRWREFRLPGGYVRLGSRYGGWWLDRGIVGADPLMVDCGLGQDISFDAAFLSRFAGAVFGIDPNPQSLAWCRTHCPPGMHLLERAFWTSAGRTLTFHLPREIVELPRGADGISGSLIGSHEYVSGGASRSVTTTDLAELLAQARRAECDVLKLDIEGAEYEVLADLAARGLLAKCRQVLVEFHHRVTHHTQQETDRVVAAVLAAGFRLVHVEGRNYSFRRSDLA